MHVGSDDVSMYS